MSWCFSQAWEHGLSIQVEPRKPGVKEVPDWQNPGQVGQQCSCGRCASRMLVGRHSQLPLLPGLNGRA